MSMHLEGPYLTTTSTKKRKEKITKKNQEDLERGWRERNVRLKEMHLPKETLEQYLEWVYGKGSKTKKKTETVCKGPISFKDKKGSTEAELSQLSVQKTKTDIRSSTSSNSKPWITGPVSSKPSPTYTGSKIIGIGTMHKSNMVPIFSDDEAKDISSMRR